MIDTILLFLFLLLTSYQDLKTSEINPRLPYFFSLLFLFLAATSGNFFNSLIMGLLAYTLGYLLYRAGQWGYGDTAILTTAGFALGISKNLSFFLSYVWNVFVLGAIYIIIYAFYISHSNTKVRKLFLRKVSTNKSLIMLLMLSSGVATYSVFYMLFGSLSAVLPAISIAALSAFMYICVIYLRLVDEHVLKRRISVDKLKVGDVIADSKLWEGITKEELKKLKKSKKYVWIKEGVRFAPAFLIALVATLLFPWF